MARPMRFATLQSKSETADLDEQLQALRRTMLNGSWSLENFNVGKMLCRGGHCSIYEAKEKQHNFPIILKTIDKTAAKRKNLMHQLVREVNIHSFLNHDNIVRMYTWFHDARYIYLVLEYAEMGDLFSELRRLQKIPEDRAAKYTYQLTNAVIYLHENAVLHRDIKPENVLLDRTGKVKLADFGWSVQAVNKKRRRTFCGTVDYMPPEIVRRQAYTYTVDIWSLGILVFEMLVGYAPFAGENRRETYRRILSAAFTIPNRVSTPAQDLIKALVKLDPGARMPLKDVQDHCWIRIYVQENC